MTTLLVAFPLVSSRGVLLSFSQKIDKLKSHLSALANLIKPTEGEKGDAEKLDDADLLILQEAGVIPAPSLRRKRKSGASQRGKHILFAESPEQGIYRFYWSSYCIFIRPVARQFASSSGSSLPSNEDMDTSEESPIELGWKLPETKKGKKRQSTSSVDAPAKPEQDSEAATVCDQVDVIDVKSHSFMT